MIDHDLFSVEYNLLIMTCFHYNSITQFYDLFNLYNVGQTSHLKITIHQL